MHRSLVLVSVGLAQTLSNWGEVIRVEPGTTFSVIGSVTNRQGGAWYHSGALFITDTVDNRAGNVMFLPTFPNSAPVPPGKVQLRGGYQWITGTDPIHFDTLELRGFSSKNLSLAAYTRHWLDLGDQMLNTHAETLYHQHTDPNSIVRLSGFVRSGIGGALERACVGGQRYLFPLGDSLPVLRYRPLYITPIGGGPYAGRFAAVDATSEGYDRNRRAPMLCVINPDFFHHISGPQGGFLEIAFDPVQDGPYDAAAHWKGSQWDSVGGVLTTNGGFSWMSQNVVNFNPTPFALALRSPTITITPSGPYELCPQDSLLLSIANPASGWTYTWSHGPQGSSVWIFSPGTYTVTATHPIGCSVMSTPIEVQGLPAPSVTIFPTSPVSICSGDSVRLVATPALSYQWFHEGLPIIGATDSILIVRDGGIYTVQATQRCGTAESAPFVLYIHPSPDAYFVSVPPDTVEFGQIFTLIDSTRGGSAWQWIIGGSVFPGSPVLTHSFSQDTVYVITLISRNVQGCLDTFTRSIYVRPFSGIFIPTGFSPNGDGTNDIFTIVAPPLEWSRLRIYSRWGILIKEIVGPPQWDGTNAAGAPVPEDVYTFVFDARLFSGQSLQRIGTVTLLR
ncbi:MAG: gliding motility-associated C-terminal domain-containing protein [Bacteroidia bacterium]|nr:gliding motility-associated C-terminal domain-containing protein [Bacteroidia bacterium]MDW8415930.1 gliding motility-associated C-terminal domain-containing protein [Bacteroidia bacterium]